MNETMTEYLKSLEREGRASTAACYEHGLRNFEAWLSVRQMDPLKASRHDLEAFQRYLAEEYRSPSGKRLSKGTQGTRIAAVKTYYAWLCKRGVLLVDLSSALAVPKVRRAKVACDFLSQQEAIALIQSQAQRVQSMKAGSQYWAIEFRNLAMLCLAIATGRRRMSLLNLKAGHFDFARNEIRIEWEKGKPGRVLPCIGWAMNVTREYIEKARPVLLAGSKNTGWLFAGQRTDRVCGEYLGRMLRQVQARAVEENPDLEELPGKHLTAHSLRVTFATMLFFNGANIRSVNELLLHERLTTTAKYTPLELEDIRRALKLAHPRA